MVYRRIAIFEKRTIKNPAQGERGRGFWGVGQCAAENGTPDTKANRASRSRKTKIQPKTDMSLTNTWAAV